MNELKEIGMSYYTAYLEPIFLACMNCFSLKAIFSVLGTVAAFLFGVDSGTVISSLLVLIMIDFVTGLIAAKVSTQPITSRRALKSAFKVAAYGLLFSAGHITDTLLPFGEDYIMQTVTAFLAATELISILENTGRMGFVVPQKLLNRLEEFRNAA